MAGRWPVAVNSAVGGGYPGAGGGRFPRPAAVIMSACRRVNRHHYPHHDRERHHHHDAGVEHLGQPRHPPRPCAAIEGRAPCPRPPLLGGKRGTARTAPARRGIPDRRSCSNRN